MPILFRLLKQRLRTTDTGGRIGGEEFGVILTDTDGRTAQTILNGLREDFGKIIQTGRDGGFSVTFSCGLACCTPGSRGAQLMEKPMQPSMRQRRAGEIE